MNEDSLHLKLENVKKLSGFLMADMLPGQYGWILTRAFVRSDQKEFYQYINQISNIYLKDLLLDEIHAFLVIIHQDLSADVYVNSLPIEYQIMAKRDLQRYVRKDDIADINALRFKGLEIKPDDNVIFCFKKGWKFGLFFDFTSYGEDSLMDVESLYQELGKHYKYLMFQDEYAILENEATFEPMFEDGWFPFSQILGGEFQSLSTFYKDKEKFAGLIDKFLDSFDEKRINSFVGNWWRSPIFKEKQTIIESGIKTYLSGDYISCIKNLYSEIEGIIRIGYVREKGKDPSTSDLMNYIEQKAKNKFISMESLGFPDIFYKYLKEVLFKSFDLKKDEVDLSRHSTAHGVAKPEQFTKDRALQAILTLDQMYRYLT